MLKVIIAGGRGYNDYEVFAEIVRKCFIKRDFNEITIVSGMARGADSMGVRFAKDHGIKLERHPANWKPNGVFNPAAGFERNEQMAAVANALIAFWDGESRGTSDMIGRATKHGLKLRVFDYDGNLTHSDVAHAK